MSELLETVNAARTNKIAVQHYEASNVSSVGKWIQGCKIRSDKNIGTHGQGWKVIIGLLQPCYGSNT